jgi:hypothetical protein
LAEGRDRAVDEAGKFGFEVVVGKAALAELAAGMVLDEDVRFGEELAKDDAAALRLDVQRDAFLVAVEVDEEAGLVVVGNVVREGAKGAGVVALWRLDLDDVGAHVRQEAGAVGAGDALGQVDDAQAFKNGVRQG